MGRFSGKLQACNDIRLRVKLPPHVGELYMPAESEARDNKERGMRQRRLKAFWKRLFELKKRAPKHDELLNKIGAAQTKSSRVVKSLVNLEDSSK